MEHLKVSKPKTRFRKFGFSKLGVKICLPATVDYVQGPLPLIADLIYVYWNLCICVDKQKQSWL